MFPTNSACSVHHENIPPFKPHFYIVKLGFTGVYIIFPTLQENIEAVLTSTHNLCFEQKYKKYQTALSENFPFLVVNFSIYLYRRIFVMHGNSLRLNEMSVSVFTNKKHLQKRI